MDTFLELNLEHMQTIDIPLGYRIKLDKAIKLYKSDLNKKESNTNTIASVEVSVSRSSKSNNNNNNNSNYESVLVNPATKIQ